MTQGHPMDWHTTHTESEQCQLQKLVYIWSLLWGQVVHVTQHCRQDHICTNRRYTIPSLAVAIVVGGCVMCLHHWHTVTHSESVRTRVLYGPITAQLLASSHIPTDSINCTLYIQFLMEITISGTYVIKKWRNYFFLNKTTFVFVI